MEQRSKGAADIIELVKPFFGGEQGMTSSMDETERAVSEQGGMPFFRLHCPSDCVTRPSSFVSWVSRLHSSGLYSVIVRRTAAIAPS